MRVLDYEEEESSGLVFLHQQWYMGLDRSGQQGVVCIGSLFSEAKRFDVCFAFFVCFLRHDEQESRWPWNLRTLLLFRGGVGIPLYAHDIDRPFFDSNAKNWRLVHL